MNWRGPNPVCAVLARNRKGFPMATSASLKDAGTMPPGEPLVLSERKDAVAVLTLNHPARRNVLSRAMLGELLSQLQAAAADPVLKCLIIRAAGPVFCAGHDLAEILAGSRDDTANLFALCTQVMEAIRLAPQVVIAEVHALATAAGCQLVAACDLAVASDNASFATPGVKIGLFCSTPGVAVTRTMPIKRALEMLFTGTAISAAEAQSLGMVNRVVTAERLHSETLDLAKRIASASAQTLALGKRTFYQQVTHDWPRAYEIAQAAMVENSQIPDAIEGMQAFLAKRPPQWRS